MAEDKKQQEQQQAAAEQSSSQPQPPAAQGAEVSAPPAAPAPPAQQEQPQQKEDPAELRARLEQSEAKLQELQAQTEKYKRILETVLKSELEGLSERDKELVAELADPENELDKLRVIRVLRAQGKIAAPAATAMPRPDSASGQSKPNTLEDARRAVIRALNS